MCVLLIRDLKDNNLKVLLNKVFLVSKITITVTGCSFKIKDTSEFFKNLSCHHRVVQTNISTTHLQYNTVFTLI